MKEEKRILVQKLKKHFRQNTSNNTCHTFLIIFTIIIGSILICFGSMWFSYQYWTDAIGASAGKYSSDTYVAIEELLSKYVGTADSPDIRGLRNGLKEIINSPESLILGATSEVVVTCEDETVLLSCSIKDGIFDAEVTAVLSEDFKIVRNNRNYTSLNHYLNYYYGYFAKCVFLSALAVTVSIVVVCIIVYFLIVFARKRIEKRKIAIIDNDQAQPQEQSQTQLQENAV